MRQTVEPTPNMRKVELAGCAGKDQFETFPLASQVAARMNKRGNGRRLMAYRCPHCGSFHVGNARK